MSDRSRNRPDSKLATDEWLTPPDIIKAAGPFDLDPCCPARMPWKTADCMTSLKTGNPDRQRHNGLLVEGDGLKTAWFGRVWCNPPYSDILPWAGRMAQHGDGLMLVPAKSFDTVWGNYVLKTASAVLFVKGRIKFYFPSGKPSTGGWGPSIIAAYDRPFDSPAPTRGRNIDALRRVRDGLHPGSIIMAADKGARAADEPAHEEQE